MNSRVRHSFLVHIHIIGSSTLKWSLFKAGGGAVEKGGVYSLWKWGHIISVQAVGRRGAKFQNIVCDCSGESTF